MARSCVFDGVTPVTVEHAMPQWVREYLPGAGKLRHYRAGTDDWHSEVMNLTVKCVCKPCNEGWMSRLEGRAKPLLIDPMQLRKRSWSSKEQRTVATWAYKTALMLSVAAGKTPVPTSHFRHLRKNLRPPGLVRIWATMHGNPNQGGGEFRVAGAESRRMSFQGTHGTKFDGYLITVMVGHLAFQVFGYDSRHALELKRPSILGLAPDAYEVQVWPVSPHPVTWPPSHGFDQEALMLYTARM